MTRPVACLVIVGLLSAGGGGASLQAQTEPDAATTEPSTRAEIRRQEREAKQGELEPYVISAAEARLLQIEQWNFPANIFVRGWNQFRPVIGGMPSGSGFVFGPGFMNGLDRESFDFQANARISTRGFTTFDALANFPTDLRGAPVQAFVRAEARNLTQLRYFGLGPGSSSGDRVNYELQGPHLRDGCPGSARGDSWSSPVVRGFLSAETRGGTGDRLITDVASPQSAARAGHQRRLRRLRG